MQKQKIDRKKAGFVLSVLLSLFFIVLAFVISRMDVKLTIGDSVMVAGSINGIVTVLSIVPMIQLVLIDRKKGFAAGLVIALSDILVMTLVIVISHKLEPVPGMVMMLATIGMMSLLYVHIKKSERTEKLLQNLSCTDSLTGLPNRRGIAEYINNLIANNSSFYIAFIDFDDFSRLTDKKSHDYGDVALVIEARRFERIMKQNECIGRFSGDEFVMIAENSDSIEEFGKRLGVYKSAIEEKLLLNQTEYAFTASIGVAKYPEDASDEKGLIYCADMAMFSAKKQGEAKICFFSEKMRNELQRYENIESMIYDAFAHKKFFLEYQPQYELHTKRIRGFEALLRLKDENGNYVPTEELINVASESNLIFRIDEWVLEEAIKNMHALFKRDDRLILTVNVFHKQSVKSEFADNLERTLSDYRFPSKQLELDIHDDGFSGFSDNLEALKNLGVRIAADNFELCYMPVAELAKMTADIIKLDRRRLSKVVEEDSSERALDVAIRMGNILNKKILIKGVETEEQLRMLRSVQADYVQGFLWGKPLELEEAVKLLS